MSTVKLKNMNFFLLEKLKFLEYFSLHLVEFHEVN